MNLSHQKSKARIVGFVAPMKKWSGHRGHKTPVRWFARREAVNQTNDDAASPSSFSSEDLTVTTDSFMTPSMEFPDRTSFRNLGGEDGEMDQISKSHVSGPGTPIDHQGSSWESERVVEDETMLPDTWPIYSNGGSINTSWQKGKLLGRGSFGSVYEGISADGELFAVKEVSLLEKGIHAQECIQQLEGKIALLGQLQHQNIVRYRGTAKDGWNLYIFLELVSQGSLLKLYQRYRLMDSVVSLYTRQILDGLKYLHDKGFIHRDIKCANILVDASGAVKLADFGLAEVSELNDLKSCKGTAFWMAPEVISPKLSDGYGSSADIWSLGCTVLEMLTRQVPYCDPENPVCALFKIATGVLPNIPHTLSLEARDFIVKCLKKNPGERPTAAELLNHPFVRRRPLSSLS